MLIIIILITFWLSLEWIQLLYSTRHVIFADGLFRDLEEFLVYGHHAGHASENKHAAVRVENRRGWHSTSGVQFEELELVAGHMHGDAVTGNYRIGDPILEPKTYGAARTLLWYIIIVTIIVVRLYNLILYIERLVELTFLL